MNIDKAISFLEKQITNPKVGLPEEIFYFISRITPMVNVDLLIKDEKQRTLLSWRDDEFHGPGWHIPGGIIRFKEKMEERVQKVAETEIGTRIEFNPYPIDVNEIIVNKDVSSGTREHFISFLYKCFLSEKHHLILKNSGLNERDAGYLKWHDFCPEDLIKVHEIYKKYI